LLTGCLRLKCSVWAIRLKAVFLFETLFQITRRREAVFLGRARTISASSLLGVFF